MSVGHVWPRAEGLLLICLDPPYHRQLCLIGPFTGRLPESANRPKFYGRRRWGRQGAALSVRSAGPHPILAGTCGSLAVRRESRTPSANNAAALHYRIDSRGSSQSPHGDEGARIGAPDIRHVNRSRFRSCDDLRWPHAAAMIAEFGFRALSRLTGYFASRKRQALATSLTPSNLPSQLMYQFSFRSSSEAGLLLPWVPRIHFVSLL